MRPGRPLRSAPWQPSRSCTCGVLHVSNAATVSTTFLLIVLVVAATSRLWVPAVTSIAAMLAFNYFFLPPVGTLTIADPQNWVALFAFLAVSLVASNLSAVARARTRGSCRPSRRAGAAVRLEPRRPVDHRQPRGHFDARAGDRPPIRPRRSSRSPCRGQPNGTCSQAGRDDRARPAAALGAFAAAQASLEFDARRADLRRPSHDGRRTASTIRLVPLRAAPSRWVCWPPRAGRRGRHARRARRRRRHRHRARAIPRRAQGGRADAPERGAEDGPARLAWTRSAHAADGHPRRGEQHAGALR